MTSLKRLAILLIFVAGCRSIIPVRELVPSPEPNISRVMMKNGTVITFDRDFGWYDREAGTIEGVTTDSQRVEYHLSELSKVETVRTYAIIPTILAGGILLGLAIFLLAKLLTAAEFL